MEVQKRSVKKRKIPFELILEVGVFCVHSEEENSPGGGSSMGKGWGHPPSPSPWQDSFVLVFLQLALHPLPRDWATGLLWEAQTDHYLSWKRWGLLGVEAQESQDYLYSEASVHSGLGFLRERCASQHLAEP